MAKKKSPSALNLFGHQVSQSTLYPTNHSFSFSVQPVIVPRYTVHERAFVFQLYFISV